MTMQPITSRVYSNSNDLETIASALPRLRSGERSDDYPGIIDLREMLSLPAIQANTRLWFDQSGELAAFAIVDAYNNLLCELPTGILTLEQEIVDWGVS